MPPEGGTPGVIPIMVSAGKLVTVTETTGSTLVVLSSLSQAVKNKNADKA